MRRQWAMMLVLLTPGLGAAAAAEPMVPAGWRVYRGGVRLAHGHVIAWLQRGLDGLLNQAAASRLGQK